ncbi:MAG TPA: NAD(P)-binding protein [Blastocatellia bacterium]|nr:NAD(P)-binding protein [Blastocatellia bacterium]
MSIDHSYYTEILDRAVIRNGQNVYIIRPDNLLVSVFSQQVRALNLVRAIYQKFLDNQKKFKKTSIAVIGGGAAGLTAAAAAAVVGANVTLFEQSRDLMPLQVGCATRALHPHIHHWPAEHAFRAVSHLPILSWTAGAAHEVAREIVGKFREIEDLVGDGLNVLHKRAMVRPGESGGSPLVFWEGSDKNGNEFDLVIVAVGLGIESTKNDLPLASYWRVDALGQPALMNATQRILISGAGDGGLIDILRATIKDFDHDTFYDDIIQRLRPVQKNIADLEEAAWKTFMEVYESSKSMTPKEKKKEALIAAEPVLKDGYKKYEEEIRLCLEGLEPKDLQPINPDFSICWVSRTCEYEVTAFPLNRLLVWWVRHYLERDEQLQSQPRFRHMTGEIKRVTLLNQEELDGPRYKVMIDGKEDPECADLVVLRHGPIPGLPVLSRAFKGEEAEINSWIETIPQRYPCVRAELIPLLGWDHANDEFKKEVTKAIDRFWKKRPPAPKVIATFFRDANDKIVSNKGVYRISVELTGELKHIRWVVYDFHPEENRVERKSAWSPFKQWVNSRFDFCIRARLSDGREVNEWLGKALREGEGEKKDAAEAIQRLETKKYPFNGRKR